MILAACSAALAVALLVRPTPTRRRSPSLHAPRARVTLSDPRVARSVSIAVGLVVVITWGGVVGIVAGVLLAVLLPRALGRLESRAMRDRREALARQAAPTADLLSACLASGAPVTSSLRAVAEAMGNPVAQPLRALVDALALGADPAIAWRALATESSLAPLARAALRSSETGAPLSHVLRGTAVDLRRDQRARADAAARASGVKAVGPLAACFLPAFLLLGVVPVVASLALPFIAGTLGT